jgi:hypothetical protein
MHVAAMRPDDARIAADCRYTVARDGHVAALLLSDVARYVLGGVKYADESVACSRLCSVVDGDGSTVSCAAGVQWISQGSHFMCLTSLG